MPEIKNEFHPEEQSCSPESDTRFRALYDSGMMGITIFEFDGRIVDANEKWLSMVGYSREELKTGEVRWDLLTPPEWMSRTLEAVEELRTKGRMTPYEKEYFRRDGAKFWGLFGGARLGGRPLGIAFSIDITERKKTEEEIGRLRSKYESILHSAGEGIYGLDNSGNHTIVNEAAVQMLGYEVEEIIGRHSHPIWHHTRADGTPYPENECKIYATLRDGIPRRVTNEVFWRKDGTSFPVEYTVTPIKEKNRITGAVVVFRDIAERRRAEEAIRISESNYRTIFDSASDAIFVHDTETGEILDVNQKMLEMYKYSREELRNLSVEALSAGTPGYTRQDALGYMRLASQGKPQVFEWLWRDKGGRLFWAEVSLRRVLLKGADRLIAVVRDITERKEAEKILKEREGQLRRNLDELAAVNKELETFNYSVSHDLRAPLRVINSFARIVLDEYSAGMKEEGRKLISSIQGHTQKMDDLIRGLLSLSRVGHQELRISSIDMERLAKDIYGELSAMISGREVQFTLNELPHAEGDPVLIRQVLSNLLGNALKFTRGRMLTRIEVSGSPELNENVYCIRDNGAGFDMRFAEKLFEPFRRAHSSSEFSGAGIGLSIVQRIVSRHGGRVWAEGEKGKGAAFCFTLPRADINSLE